MVKISHYTKCVCCQEPKTFVVNEEDQKLMKESTKRTAYSIKVSYPGTDRILEFIGMDRGSCIMQAEVAKQEGDDLMLMQSEETITVLNKEKI